jgi:phosphate-selective porin
MRLEKPWSVLLVLLGCAFAPGAFAEGASPADDSARSSGAAVPPGNTQLAMADDALAGNDAAPGAGASAPTLDSLQKQIDELKTKMGKSSAGTAGWNGEHFYLKSSDGAFTLMPVGQLIGQWAYYNNNDYGAPPSTFAIRAARFGFQGNYGDQLDFGMTFDTVSSPIVRDAFIIVKSSKALNVEMGQFKVPFSMEVGTADTAIEFYNRSPISMLYPDVNGGNRAPGISVFGSFAGDTFDYHVGLFDGQGILTTATTNEPEIVGRLRFSPFKTSDMDLLKGLSFGASYEHSRSRGQSNEQSFSGAMNDGVYTFFPSFRINGNVNRYDLFASWLTGPLGLRAEYVHLSQDREGLGPYGTGGGSGYNSQPPVTASGFYVSATYFLTGETAPLNAVPRVKHPVIGPGSPGESGAPGWGAWAIKARYSKVTGDSPAYTCDANTTPACPLTPTFAPEFNDTTDQFSVGFNWYLNYWVVLKSDLNIDRLKDPSVQGIGPHNYTVFLETLQYRF